jgi:hypothetical protein
MTVSRPQRLGVVGRVALVVGGLFLLGVIVVFTPVFLVKALQLKDVRLRPQVSVYDRETKAPVPGCLLTFGQVFGLDEAEPRTGPDGQIKGIRESAYMHGRWPLSRRREPKLRFSLGQIPQAGLDAEAEFWDLKLSFREPWGWASGAAIVPQVQLVRSLVHLKTREADIGWDEVPRALETERAEAPPVKAVVRLVIEQGQWGEQRSYDIPLSIFLGRDQIAACQAPTPLELFERMDARFDAGQCREALEDFQSVKFRREQDFVLRFIESHKKAGDCLRKLGRKQEAIEVYRRGGELWPSQTAAFDQAARAVR